MKTIITLSILALLAWYGFKQYNESQEAAVNSASNMQSEYYKCTAADGSVSYGQVPAGTKCQKIHSADSGTTSYLAADLAAEKYHCDGRTHCSQMTSCEEATYFLKSCPNVEMDGNNDGVPCERQWCR